MQKTVYDDALTFPAVPRQDKAGVQGAASIDRRRYNRETLPGGAQVCSLFAIIAKQQIASLKKG